MTAKKTYSKQFKEEALRLQQQGNQSQTARVPGIQLSVRRNRIYLAVVLDLYSRTVVGWAMDENMERELVISALGMASLAIHA